MRIWSIVVLGVLAVALVALVAACGRSTDDALDRVEATPGSTATSGNGASKVVSVAIVGDSITEFGQAVLRERLGDGRSLQIDGKSGYTVLQQLPAAEVLARAEPAQVIVNLGTNDVWRGRSTAQIAADLQMVVDRFPDATCIHLVTIAEGMADPGTGADLAAPAIAANAAIRALAADDARIHVIDWAGRAQSLLDTGEPDDAIFTDTIHPTQLGHEALAELYEDALESCGG